MKACFPTRLPGSTALPRIPRFRQHHAAQRQKLKFTACARKDSEASVGEMVSKEEAVPTLSLFCVALLWATFGPALRFIYAGEGAPDPAVLAAASSVITTVVLVLFAQAWQLNDSRNASGSQHPSAPLAHSTHLQQQRSPDEEQPSLAFQSPPPQEYAGEGPFKSATWLLTRRTSSLGMASFELGLLGAAGSLVHTVGLSEVPATTAGFLVQTTTVITPCLAFLAGEHVSKRTWAACAVAVVGTILVTADGLSEASSLAGALAGGTVTGKLTVLSAALFYSLTFRTTELAAGKNVFRCLALVAAASPAIYQAVRIPQGDLDVALASLWPSISAVGVVAFVYSALGPGALSAVLQTYGQRTVSAPVAQVIYTSIPLWSGWLAFTFLGEQPFGGIGWCGAACIILAGLIIASAGRASNS